MEGKILALRKMWGCCNDIFRAAVRVIDEYQMLCVVPRERLIKWKETKENVNRRRENKNVSS